MAAGDTNVGLTPICSIRSQRRYQHQHDLQLNHIWNKNGLEAELHPTLTCNLHLYNGGHAANPNLILELTRELDEESDERVQELPRPLNVSDYSVEQIAALLPAPATAP